MSSLFGELDIASAQDDPFKVPPNTYFAYLTDVSVKDSKGGVNESTGKVKKVKQGLNLTYTLDGGEHNGKKIQEWKEIPTDNTDDVERAKSFLKQRMLSLGVPESRINEVGPDDLVGTRVVLAVGENSAGYSTVNRVAVAESTQQTSQKLDF